MPEKLRVTVIGSSAGGGDWPPLVAAALALRNRGHHVHYIGDDPLREKLDRTGLDVQAVPAGLDLPSKYREWMQHSAADPMAALPHVRWIDDAGELIEEEARSRSPDLLLCSDFTALMARKVANELNVPVCVVNATFYAGPGSFRNGESDFVVPEAAKIFEEIFSAADLVLHATDPEFDPPPSPPPDNHHWIGTLIWEPSDSPPGYLSDAGDPWALVTLSSLQQEGEGELAAAAVRALADFPLSVLLTLGDPERAALSLDDAENVRIESFVSHSPVLERARLCVSHAGHGIVAKALYHGVPMVLIPWDRDQPGVAARAEALGVARVVQRSELSPATLAEAIRSVLSGSEYRENAERHGRRIRARNSQAEFCGIVERFVRTS